MSEFVEFPKIARFSRECVITEKIDGSNAQIIIAPYHEPEIGMVHDCEKFPHVARVGGLAIGAGSRSRYIHHVTGDNFGFSAWVHAHAEELIALGEGRHFGEWWGSGIQRGYGLLKGAKRFSLFNVARWHQADKEPYISATADLRQPPKLSTEAPACCHVVPVLYRGDFQTTAVDLCLTNLRELGSKASPGFMNPEGVVVFHTASGQMFKKTIEKDAEPKSRHVPRVTVEQPVAAPAVESVVGNG